MMMAKFSLYQRQWDQSSLGYENFAITSFDHYFAIFHKCYCDVTLLILVLFISYFDRLHLFVYLNLMD